MDFEYVKYRDGVALVKYFGCSESVNIPESVTIGKRRVKVREIGNSCFENNHRIVSVTIPNTVRYIGGDAFFLCKNLRFVNIPKSIVSISPWAFWGCANLTDIHIDNEICILNNYSIPKDTVIHGHKGSTAEIYSKMFGNKFKEIK